MELVAQFSTSWLHPLGLVYFLLLKSHTARQKMWSPEDTYCNDSTIQQKGPSTATPHYDSHFQNCIHPAYLSVSATVNAFLNHFTGWNDPLDFRFAATANNRFSIKAWWLQTSLAFFKKLNDTTKKQPAWIQSTKPAFEFLPLNVFDQTTRPPRMHEK